MNLGYSSGTNVFQPTPALYYNTRYVIEVRSRIVLIHDWSNILSSSNFVYWSCPVLSVLYCQCTLIASHCECTSIQ
jgi:hypothetical protein